VRFVRGDAVKSLTDYRMVDSEAPCPGPGEIRIAVQCCGMGFVDALVATGGYQVKPPMPFTPGQEYAGIVDAVGAGVSSFADGDRVMCSSFGGGLAEQTIVKESFAWHIPPEMTFAQAAGFRINYVTALHALMDRAEIRPGEKLLVLGAAGGVGSAAVQLGTLLGAAVLAAGSSAEKRSHAIDLGASDAIDTDPEDWRDRLKQACGGKGPDVVFDPVCGPLFEPAFRSLNWRGRHLVVGFAAGDIPKLAANLPLMKGAALMGVDVRQFLLYEPDLAAKHLGRLLDWVSDGRLNPPVGKRFPFNEFSEAMHFALSGKGLGKAVIDVV